MLNIAYNELTGGTCLENIERLRNDETYMKRARRRRFTYGSPEISASFDEVWIYALQETINQARNGKSGCCRMMASGKRPLSMWMGRSPGRRGSARKNKDIAYNGIWGYAPLIVTLANTNEVLYLMNRPGSRPSADGAAEWMDRAIDLAAPVFKKVWLRGDTPFFSDPQLRSLGREGRFCFRL